MERAPEREVFELEIRTRSLRQAMAFYRRVFDWDWRIDSAAQDDALVDGGVMPVISLHQTSDPRMPLAVVMKILVEDCTREGERALALGGRVTVPRLVVPDSGAAIGIEDPWGNELVFCEPLATARPKLTGRGVNPVVLVEIVSPDLPAALRYYHALCGWSFSGIVFDDGHALTEGCGLERGVGVLATAPGRAERSTSYVAVTSLAETARELAEHGGRVVVGPAELPGEGRFVVFEDPEGNRLGALERL